MSTPRTIQPPFRREQAAPEQCRLPASVGPRLLAGLVAVALAACGGDPAGPPATSALDGRAWAAGQLVAPSLEVLPDHLQAGIADDGAVVVGATAASGGAFVVHGRPNPPGQAPTWSTPRLVASFGVRGGDAAPTDLVVERVVVAANGAALLLVRGTGGGCPPIASAPTTPTNCWFASSYDPQRDQWSPLDLVVRTDLARRVLANGSLQAVHNSRGDSAVYLVSVAEDGRSTPPGGWPAVVFWRAAGEAGFRRTDVSMTPEAAVMSLDERGGMVLASIVDGPWPTPVSNPANSQDQVQLNVGSVGNGFGPAVRLGLETRASLVGLWTGRNGQRFLFWKQPETFTTSRTVLFGARTLDASTPFQVTNLGVQFPSLAPGLLWSRAVVTDDGEWRFVAGPSNDRCGSLRWASVDPQPRESRPVPDCIFTGNSWQQAFSRTGDVLDVGPANAWATFDSGLNSQRSMPPASGVRTGPGFVFGAEWRLQTGDAPAPQPSAVSAWTAATGELRIDSSPLMLSTSGIGAYVFAGAYDVLPTQDAPLPQGRPGVRRLWVTYLK